jgi:hypothetical protein
MVASLSFGPTLVQNRIDPFRAMLVVEHGNQKQVAAHHSSSAFSSSLRAMNSSTDESIPFMEPRART